MFAGSVWEQLKETDVHRLHNWDNQRVTNRYYATHAELSEGTAPISTATNNVHRDIEEFEKDGINQCKHYIAKSSSSKSTRKFFDDIINYFFT